MQLDASQFIVRQPNCRHTFAFPPSTTTVDLPKKRANFDPGAGRDGLDLFDFADDFERQSPIVVENSLFGKSS